MDIARYSLEVDMKWFKKMVEVANRDGIWYGDEEGEAVHVPVKIFNGYVEKNNVFVFTPINSEPFALDDEEMYPEIDAPFDIISIEMLGGRPLTSNNPFDYDYECDLYCVMNFDMGGGVHGQYFLAFLKGQWTVWMTNTLRKLVKPMLDRINEQEDGLERVRCKFKIGSGKEKRFHTIRKIIHIRPKLKRERSEEIPSGRKVDFTHRFIRRGHWRELPGGLGKNRIGEYCESGRTWVNQSRPIGPSDKPFIKKVRIVKE
jgi:hypothetical protein